MYRDLDSLSVGPKYQPCLVIVWIDPESVVIGVESTGKRDETSNDEGTRSVLPQDPSSLRSRSVT